MSQKIIVSLRSHNKKKRRLDDFYGLAKRDYFHKASLQAGDGL